MKKAMRGTHTLILSCLVLTASLYGIAYEGNDEKYVSYSQCMEAATEIRQQAEDASLADNRYSMITANPFLRTDRFYGNIAVPTSNEEQLEELTLAFLQFGSMALRNEFINLPMPAQKRFNEKYELSPKILINKCQQTFLSKFKDIIRNSEKGDIEFPDNYSLTKRVLGVYPLFQWTTLFARLDYRYEMNKLVNNPHTFRKPNYYQMADQDFTMTPSEVESILAKARASSPLGIPVVAEHEIHRLMNFFAPVWKIDVLGESDLFGQPIVNSAGTPSTNAKPRTYTYPSYTRIGNKTLLQLNYVIWFPERPRLQLIDVYKGNLDSIIWRVTLDDDGTVLLYDTIHSCGCYYKQYLASDRLNLKKRIRGENPLTYNGQFPDGYNGRIVVPVTGGSHYALRPYTEDALIPDLTYVPLDYENLAFISIVENNRVMGKTRLFDEDNLIPGTERLERFLLWPFGIKSPGAMRQAGHHAIAFIGKRHFDDPRLLENYLNYTAGK